MIANKRRKAFLRLNQQQTARRGEGLLPPLGPPVLRYPPQRAFPARNARPESVHFVMSSQGQSGCPSLAAQRKPPKAKTLLPSSRLAAKNRNLSGGAATFAPNFAVETTPIENWLEIEDGVSPFFTGNSTEWDTNLIFTKPWTLSRKQSSCSGSDCSGFTCGRTASRRIRLGRTRSRFHVLASAQTALRMVLGPAYDYSFARGDTQSIGMSAGLLTAIHDAELLFHRRIVSGAETRPASSDRLLPYALRSPRGKRRGAGREQRRNLPMGDGRLC